MSEATHAATVNTDAEKAALAEQTAKEKAEREAAELRFKAAQYQRLTEIGLTYLRMEANRAKDMLAVSRKIADYVDNAMCHASEKGKAKALNTAVSEVEKSLAEYTDESIGVSRLLGVYGLAFLADDTELVSRIPVSTLKVLLPLIQRDATAPGLSYTWKSDAVQAGAKRLLTDCADGKHTVKSAVAERDKLLGIKDEEPTTPPTPPPEPKSPVQKAAQKIGAALKALGKDAESRSKAIKRLVKTDQLGTAELIAGLQGLAISDRVDDLKRVMAAGKLILMKLAEKQSAAPLAVGK